MDGEAEISGSDHDHDQDRADQSELSRGTASVVTSCVTDKPAQRLQNGRSPSRSLRKAALLFHSISFH
jgi:hypothetical protein